MHLTLWCTVLGRPVREQGGCETSKATTPQAQSLPKPNKEKSFGTHPTLIFWHLLVFYDYYGVLSR
jgi:hypothetical protein